MIKRGHLAVPLLLFLLKEKKNTFLHHFLIKKYTPFINQKEKENNKSTFLLKWGQSSASSVSFLCNWVPSSSAVRCYGPGACERPWAKGFCSLSLTGECQYRHLSTRNPPSALRFVLLVAHKKNREKKKRKGIREAPIIWIFWNTDACHILQRAL
jgi:hypothetical protein